MICSDKDCLMGTAYGKYDKHYLESGFDDGSRKQGNTCKWSWGKSKAKILIKWGRLPIKIVQQIVLAIKTN